MTWVGSRFCASLFYSQGVFYDKQATHERCDTGLLLGMSSSLVNERYDVFRNRDQLNSLSNFCTHKQLHNTWNFGEISLCIDKLWQFECS